MQNKLIDWAQIPSGVFKTKAYQKLFPLMQDEHYPENWTLTGLILDDDTRKYICYSILEGKNTKGIMYPENVSTLKFRLEVLTRQACVSDKDGNKIWLSDEARDFYGDKKDIVPDYSEAPEPGDIVECKGRRKEQDENGREVDASITKKWARNGIRECEYFKYKVDEDGCISVPFIQALTMLTKHGKRIAQPQFKKMNRMKKASEQRRLTNWWFEEVV